MSYGARPSKNLLCPACDAERKAWFSTCPSCDFPLEMGPDAILEGMFAPPLVETEQWIDIAVGSDQPVRAALLRTFLRERGFEFDESRRFVSIRMADADAVEAAIRSWAYRQDLPDDDRHLDTLTATLNEVGDAALAAIRAASNSELRHPSARGAAARLEAERLGFEPVDEQPPDVDLR